MCHEAWWVKNGLALDSPRRRKKATNCLEPQNLGFYHGEKVIEMLCPFFAVVVANFHTLGDLKQQKFILLQLGRPEGRNLYLS